MICPGWPKDGASGDYLGWDDEGRVSILRWLERTPLGSPGCWVGVMLNKEESSHWPLAFTRGEGAEHFVTRHCRADATMSKLEVVPDYYLNSIPGFEG